MINEGLGQFLILNGEIIEKDEADIFEKINKPSLYEVVTVLEGVPVFFEEHMERLENTSNMLDIKLQRSPEELEEDFYKLISANKIDKGFIKLIIFEDDYLVYEFWDKYPTDEEFEDGIVISIYDYERENPNAKILRTDFKAEVNKHLIQTDAFEAILRTEEGELLEGSRTNLYFTKGNKVITAPDSRVLKGITRTRIEKIFKNEKIDVEKKIIKDIDLVDVDGAFITGTTVGVVPIKSIESIELNSQENPLIQKIVQGYKNLQREYIKEKESRDF